MLRDVIRRGTGQRARALGRDDLAGKTGTTNEGHDTWFNGFNPDLVATAWVGFDQERPLGGDEEGARTALPMWIYFMREALAGVPEHPLPMPAGSSPRASRADPTCSASDDASASSSTSSPTTCRPGVAGEGDVPGRAARRSGTKSRFSDARSDSVRGDMMRQAHRARGRAPHDRARASRTSASPSARPPSASA